MHPYRDLECSAGSENKPRNIIKTYWWKLLIAVKGTWKKRYFRCNDCLTKWERTHLYTCDPFFHSLKHRAQKLRAKNKSS